MEKPIPQENSLNSSHIGSDESGKGDFFGPLVIAACFVGPKESTELTSLGVQDSKALTDTRVLSLAKEIGKRCQSHIVTILPFRYNELYRQFGNLNTLLAWGHITAIEELLKRVGTFPVLVDCFSKGELVKELGKKKKPPIEIEERVRAESDIAVAAASCLARAQFLVSLRRLEEKAQHPLPKGAGAPVDRALSLFLQDHDEEALGHYAKLHFKTLEKVKRKK